MRLKTRKLLDKSFSSFGIISIALMAATLLIILIPIIWRGSQAFIFTGTIEHQKVMYDNWNRGNKEELTANIAKTEKAREPIYAMLAKFELEMKEMKRSERRTYKSEFKEVKKLLRLIIGPLQGERKPVLMRQQYGQTRWDRANVKLKDFLYNTEWDYSDANNVKKIFVPRCEIFKNTSLTELFSYVENNLEKMVNPKLTFYPQFLTDSAKDSHIFGGIWPELLGTIYLTLGAMIFAIPIGIITAIYFCEYAKKGPIISFLRICISTLAGVPSIVFGLFGLAFFLNTIKVSETKSVLAGSLTLSLLILPTIIRASEEAIMSVPKTYKEASLALGAGKWKTIMTIILPAALPGVLTGIVISMGRAAGETAPIIFTAAVSVGKALGIDQVLTNPTPALPWNIYNLCTEHEAVDEIRHVQYGMVLSLIAVVLVLNIAAIIMRARITKKLKG